ncbi:MAG: cytoplasmic protein [Desulfobacterales bacterium]|nr:cytoplasmic protein [Desulfobacterales bacterium]
MLKKSLIIRDPIKLLGLETDQTFQDKGCGAIFARAGVGKTALLVQLAINSLLQEKPVLHISLKDPVDKVDLWYKEVFQNITKLNDIGPSDRVWDEILPYRFIMAFESRAFSLKRLMGKIEELRSQEIFAPKLIMIDGFSITDADPAELDELKEFAWANGFIIWFTIRGHRGESQTPDAFSSKFLNQYGDFFDVILQLSPEKDQIQVKPLKKETANHPLLFLDPSTLLIREDRV